MTRMSWRNAVPAITAIAFISAAAPAMAKPQIELKITQEKEVTTGKKGSETTKLVLSTTAVPGDTLQYTLTYQNKGDEMATNAVIDDPIPKGMTYIANSAAGENAAITFSTDNGKTYAEATMLTYEMTMPDGKVVKKAVSPDAYTNVRWVVKQVPPGTSGKVTFKVKVT